MDIYETTAALIEAEGDSLGSVAANLSLAIESADYGIACVHVFRVLCQAENLTAGAKGLLALAASEIAESDFFGLSSEALEVLAAMSPAPKEAAAKSAKSNV